MNASTFSTAHNRKILGIAFTGAKFTPKNHKLTGDPILDAISRGDLVPVSPEEIAAEVRAVYALGARYLHHHARNPDTREQTCNLDDYRRFARIAAGTAPDALTSYGASRNGSEITAAIVQEGEWARVAQAELSREDDGADFVTAVAAIELQIVTDMERQGYIRINESTDTVDILKDLAAYVPSHVEGSADLGVNSTAGGANYGKSSPEIQFETLMQVVRARREHGLPFEVEWVQDKRSALLTHYLASLREDGLRSIGRLNLTLLFGFSQRLKFQETYAAFRKIVDRARAIAEMPEGASAALRRPLEVSIAVGAAVLPQHALQHRKPIDVGPLAGRLAGPMERLVAWACQPDSGVDIIRVGLEDTPFTIDPAGRVIPTTNPALVETAARLMNAHGVTIETDASTIARFGRRT